MLRKLFVLCAVTASSFAVNSQIEIEGGLNLSNQSSKTDGEKNDTDTKMNPGFNLGAVYRVELSNNLHFLPGLVWNTRGSRYVSGGSTNSLNLNYVTIPLNFRIHFDVSSNLKAFINAAPYVGFAISGSNRYKDSDEKEVEKVDFSDDFGYNRLDYGLNFGFGVDLDKFTVSAGYDFGIANIIRIPSGADFKENNSTLKVTFGYKL